MSLNTIPRKKGGGRVTGRFCACCKLFWLILKNTVFCADSNALISSNFFVRRNWAFGSIRTQRTELDGLSADRNAGLPNCFHGGKWQGESALRNWLLIADFVVTNVQVWHGSNSQLFMLWPWFWSNFIDNSIANKVQSLIWPNMYRFHRYFRQNF